MGLRAVDGEGRDEDAAARTQVKVRILQEKIASFAWRISLMRLLTRFLSVLRSCCGQWVKNSTSKRKLER